MVLFNFKLSHLLVDGQATELTLMRVDGDGCGGDALLRGGHVDNLHGTSLVSWEDHELATCALVADMAAHPHRRHFAQTSRVLPRRNRVKLLATIGKREHMDLGPETDIECVKNNTTLDCTS